MAFRLIALTAFFCSPLLLQAQEASSGIPERTPADLGFDAARLALIDEIVREGVDTAKMPGCVVVVGRREGVVYRKAFGFRQTVPDKVPMTIDTVFDLASLTKPIATATSVMILIGQKKIDPEATAATYWPEFGKNGKEAITVRQLLTHTGGLIADNSIKDYEGTPEESLAKICELKPTSAPGSEFTYSDVGFIVLGEIVRKVSGQSVHEFSRHHIYAPLSMKETGYLPGETLRARAAVTEQRDNRWMQGEVHDPRAWALGGVAGHAGLFSTADDLSRYAVMMLNQGKLGDTTILDPTTWKLMTTAVDVPRGRRALGWDARTGYSSNRGDLMSSAAFGHGGFTGTGIWIDPVENMFVLFLSNRVHPDGKGLVNPLIGRVATIAGAALRDGSVVVNRRVADVRNGIDVLRENKFESLKGRTIGLITNQTGLSRDGVSTIRLLHEADGVKLAALFSPEHGLEGKLDIPKIGDQKDQTTGLKVFSLYGETRTPSKESFSGLDTLVFDIQDIGCRFYTYVSTMGNAMKAAAAGNIRFVVLDRVNPIGGADVAGPLLNEGDQSFVGYHTLPVRHGMTAGELATMFVREMPELKSLDLQIVKVEGWNRSQMFDETGLTWINPSPNMRNLNEAILYPGVGLLEMTNVSVGRGTDTPFEVVGAPWIRERELAAELNAAGLPGLRFVPTQFTPDSSKFANESCGGVSILMTDRSVVEPVRLGIQLMCSLRKLHASEWETKNMNRLLSSVAVRDAVLAGTTAQEIVRLWQPELQDFLKRRSHCLLYP
ncbi:MAG: DUF1343 domain-containing protein [Planctomycetaceae bacterium]